jgi:hypothetical protein
LAMERAGVGASEAGRRASFNNRRDQRYAVDSNGRAMWTRS